MVKKRRCVIEGNEFSYNKKMTCDSEGCFLNDFPEEQFTLWSTNFLHGYKCRYERKNIIATNINENIFGTKCNASSFYCRSRGEITVWNDTIIHRCPYEVIRLPGRYEWIDEYIVNSESNILLRPTHKSIICGIPMLNTDEGIYVVRKEERQELDKNKIKISTNNEFINKLILSNIDL